MDPIGAVVAVAVAFAPIVIYLVRSSHRPDTQEILVLCVGWLIVMMALAFVAQVLIRGTAGYTLMAIIWVAASCYAWVQAGKEKTEKSAKRDSNSP